MPRFRVRNLTVAIDSPQDAAAACGPVWSCPGGPVGSFCVQPTWQCPGNSIICPGNSIVCPGNSVLCRFPSNDCVGKTLVPCGGFTDPCVHGSCGLNFSTIRSPDLVRQVQLVPDKVAQAEMLSELKSDLQQAMKELEAQEKAVTAEAGPQTLEEAEALEDSLKEALEGVSAMKKKLKK